MRFRIFYLFVSIFLFLAPLGAEEADAALDALRQDLSMIFTGRQMADAQWGVAVYSLDRGEYLFEHNARKLYTPASNEKLVTAAAALLRLGPEYRFKTNVLIDGAVEGGVLRGDLIIQGFGDPSASARMRRDKDPFAVFREWSVRLKARGVRAVAGRIVGDATSFAGSRYGRGWEWDDLFESYAAPVSALQFNENFVSLDIKPRASGMAGSRPGDAAVAEQKPLPDYLRVEGGVTTRAGGNKITVSRVTGAADGEKEAVKIGGAIPPGSAAFNQLVAVERPVRYYLEAFRYLLGQEGIDVSGCAVAETAAPTSDKPLKPPKLLWTQESAPLAELLAPIMKESLNLPAETLLRVLGREVRGAGTDEDGVQVVQDVLAAMGVPKGSYIYADASGLSRRSLVSADILVKILGFMHKQPTFAPFYSALAVAGADGTLKNRFKKTAAEGNLRAKTGTMSGVSAISGYMKTADGETLAFSMIANNYPFPKATAEAAQNRALIRLASFSRK